MSRLHNRVLFVVHRYHPFPGGSEYYVQNMAEEMVARGIDAWVLTGQHKVDGDTLHGVTVTKDINVLLRPDFFDLVVVHGCDVMIQNIALANAKDIPTPILYLIIKPSNSAISLQAIKECAYLGASAPEDKDHIAKVLGGELDNRVYQVRHGIPIERRWTPSYMPSGTKTHKEAAHYYMTRRDSGILGYYPGQKENPVISPSDKLFVSVGGFWKHKGMAELVEVFNSLKLPSTKLLLYGYHTDPAECDVIYPTDNIAVFGHASESTVRLAIAGADVLIMNSYEEGFGLVLLEAMINRTPFLARHIAGARILGFHGGATYTTRDQLAELLKAVPFPGYNGEAAQKYVFQNHMIYNTVDDILAVIDDIERKKRTF